MATGRAKRKHENEAMAKKLMDPAGQQPFEFKKLKKDDANHLLTNNAGIPIGRTACLTVGQRGPILMQDDKYMEEAEEFVFSVTKPRAVFSKGCGGFGSFEVTNDISKYCKASLFSEVGKKTPIAVRFSMMSSDLGTPDGNRDVRGFSIKFFTEQGNWDLVGISTPAFFVRDPFLYPSLAKSLKRNPVTNLKAPEAYWDFVAHRPETLNTVLCNYSFLGTPYSYRHINGYSVNTFAMIGPSGNRTFVRFQWITDQGLKSLIPEETKELNACDPDFAARDVYNAISEGRSTSWTLNFQMLAAEDVSKMKEFNPFDCTKSWPTEDFPLIEIGKIVVDKNPKNYFAEIEQLVFNPANLPPGIQPSPDRVLQGRMLIYRQAGRNRVGTNYMQLPVNCPYKGHVANYGNGGEMSFKYDTTGRPIYFPNSFGGPLPDPKFKEQPKEETGIVDRYDIGETEDNYSQPKKFFMEKLTSEEREQLMENIAEHLQHSSPMIQEKVLEHFHKVQKELGDGVKKGIQTRISERMTAAAE